MPVQVPDVLHVGRGSERICCSRCWIIEVIMEISELWTSVYPLPQACIIQFSAQRGGMKHSALPVSEQIIKSDICLVGKHRSVNSF